jgi:hypothetical protein
LLLCVRVRERGEREDVEGERGDGVFRVRVRVRVRKV